MHKYSNIHAIYLSFFSKDFYKDVLQNRKGLGFSYLFFINFITLVGVIAIFLFQVYKFDTKKIADEITNKMFQGSEQTFEQNLKRVLDVISQIPRLTFNNGSISTNKQEPYYIKDPVSGKDIIIFDTTGYHNDLQGTDAVMLFTKTKIITKKNKNTEQAHYISEMTAEQGSEQDFNVIFAIISQIPKITITNGIASIEEHVPYNIVDDKGHPLVIIDTSEEYEPIDDKRAFILITKDKIFYKDMFSENPDDKLVKEMSIADINEDMIYFFLESTSDTIRSFLLWFTPLVIFPLLLLFYFVSSLIVILIVAIITLLFGSIVKLQSFEYENALRMTCFAITPVLVLKRFAPEMFPSQSLIYFLILLGYLYFSVYSNAGNNKPEA